MCPDVRKLAVYTVHLQRWCIEDKLVKEPGGTYSTVSWNFQSGEALGVA